jgi:hypothetical protein
MWGPSVRKKRKEKEKKERGPWVVAGWAVGPRLAQLGFCSFFLVLFLFLFSVLCLF